MLKIALTIFDMHSSRPLKIPLSFDATVWIAAFLTAESYTINLVRCKHISTTHLIRVHLRKVQSNTEYFFKLKNFPVWFMHYREGYNIAERCQCYRRRLFVMKECTKFLHYVEVDCTLMIGFSVSQKNQAGNLLSLIKDLVSPLACSFTGVCIYYHGYFDESVVMQLCIYVLCVMVHLLFYHLDKSYSQFMSLYSFCWPWTETFINRGGKDTF